MCNQEQCFYCFFLYTIFFASIFFASSGGEFSRFGSISKQYYIVLFHFSVPQAKKSVFFESKQNFLLISIILWEDFHIFQKIDHESTLGPKSPMANFSKNLPSGWQKKTTGTFPSKNRDGPRFFLMRNIITNSVSKPRAIGLLNVSRFGNCRCDFGRYLLTYLLIITNQPTDMLIFFSPWLSLKTGQGRDKIAFFSALRAANLKIWSDFTLQNRIFFRRFAPKFWKCRPDFTLQNHIFFRRFAPDQFRSTLVIFLKISSKCWKSDYFMGAGSNSKYWFRNL